MIPKSPDSDVAMVLGAGASLAAPAARPLFAWLRDALIGHVNLPIEADVVTERFAYLAPEALLSRLGDRGIPIDDELRHLLAGGAPNALHHAAAAVLARGCAVWTTNFDELVEAAADLRDIVFHRLLPGDDPACDCRRGHLVKVHGTLGCGRVVARSEDVLAPLPAPWLERLRGDLRDVEVAVVGYAGADIDLRSGLRDALAGTGRTTWFGTSRDHDALYARFGGLIDRGVVRLALSDRPDIEALRWAAGHDLDAETPKEVDIATRGPVPEVRLPEPKFTTDDLLRARVLDDFGKPDLAGALYRRAALRGPDRRAAARAVLSTGLIHGAPWRPPVVGVLRVLAATPLRCAWLHQQLVLFYTWSGRPQRSWAAAQRALDVIGQEPGLVMQAANAAKECEPAAAVPLARAAQRRALTPGSAPQAAMAAWATFCLSFALRWLGDVQSSAEQAGRLADGLDALAGPVWAAWGQFELGALSALGDNANEAARRMTAVATSSKRQARATSSLTRCAVKLSRSGSAATRRPVLPSMRGPGPWLTAANGQAGSPARCFWSKSPRVYARKGTSTGPGTAIGCCPVVRQSRSGCSGCSGSGRCSASAANALRRRGVRSRRVRIGSSALAKCMPR